MQTFVSRWADSQLIGTRTRSVWQWQLIFTFSVVAIAVVIAILDETIITHWAFLLGIGLIVAASTVSLVTPWAQYPKGVALTLPIVDIIGVGLMAVSESNLGYLWVFPIAWISTYYSTRELIGALAVTGFMNLVDTWPRGYSAAVILELLIVLLALAFLGITIIVGARRTRAFRHLTRRQAERLDRTLRRVQSAETRAVAVFDSISVALARVSASGELVAANTSYRALYAMDPRDLHFSAAGAVEYTDYRGTAVPASETSLARAARGELVEGEQLWLFDRTGAWRTMGMSITAAQPNSLGEQTFLIELEDLTAVTDAQREQPNITRVVSHELRNPLTAILGHADLLLESDGLTRSQRDHLEVIESASERMLTLIQGLLNQTRDADNARTVFDLGHVLAASVEAFTPAAAAAAITIHGTIVGPLNVEGDEFRLRQVIDNIVSNAIKYTDRGTVSVDARAAGSSIDIVIGDDGIGMTPEDVERMFTPYFRAQSVQDDGITGTGLGMGITRDIVESHGGNITVESALGKGTTVSISLPLVPTTPEGPTP
ncbi:sensor histidine kinase [Microbacterium dauci]|uniref:histidine kinase n=1 Tax=Microbacterium dauci TaxID=3048008 RepID=A0ABT6ZE69_9MICO|nr:HAMP domain-containing sensor histidine kinase [Microbacterium sp. LX3-4]MDJ1114438.1 HAMP domain-containing sensor histidine kinase [Microbacterium sp. LX3-4]